MTYVGKSLVFYLKYRAEMTRLFEEQASLPEIDQHPDKKRILKQVDDVGRVASEEAAALIGACVSKLQDRLERISGVGCRYSQPSTIQRNWGIEITLHAKNGKQPNGTTRQLGLYLEEDELVPWIWSRGGLAVEERIVKLLPPGVAWQSAKRRGWMGGSIALKPSKVRWEEAKGFILEADAIVASVQKTLEAITPDFITKFVAPRLE